MSVTFVATPSPNFNGQLVSTEVEEHRGESINYLEKNKKNLSIKKNMIQPRYLDCVSREDLVKYPFAYLGQRT